MFLPSVLRSMPLIIGARGCLSLVLLVALLGICLSSLVVRILIPRVDLLTLDTPLAMLCSSSGS